MNKNKDDLTDAVVVVAAFAVPTAAVAGLSGAQPRLPRRHERGGGGRHVDAAVAAVGRVVLHQPQHQVRQVREVPRGQDSRLHGAFPQAGRPRGPLRPPA